VTGRRTVWCCRGVLAALALCLAAVQASAQMVLQAPDPVPSASSVIGQYRPDYDALGLRAGSFLILPSADVVESWDSNIYATSTRDTSDRYTTLAPQLRLNSDWNNHALNLLFSDQSEIYNTHSTENINNVTGAAEGRLDIENGIYLTGGGSAQILHEERSSPNAVTNAKSPTEYHVTDGNLGFVHDTGVIGLRVNTEVDSYSYNNDSTSTGILIPQSYRNYISYKATPRVTYEIVPGYHAFIQTPFNEDQYVSRNPSGYNQSSHGYEGDIGTAINLGSALNGEIFAGYFRQEVEDHRLSNSQGPGGGANLLWNVTELTSLRFSASRIVGQTTVEPASAMISSAANFSVEHELLPNVLLTAGAGLDQDQFSGISRTDNNLTGAIGAQYLLNRVLSLGLDGTFYHRDSNVPGVGYDREIIELKLHNQL
jgi:hypothetical protein